MKASIRDPNAINSLNPISIIAYLKAHGWNKFNEKNGRYSIWHHSENLDAEILVPIRKDSQDFSLKASDILKELEIVEGRSQLEIIRDLQNSGFDLIRLRSHGAGTSDGTLKISDGVALFTEAREIILAAACATIQPRPYYHARKPQAANEYLEKVRLGQTEHGSYVLTILSPVSPQLTPHGEGNLFPEEPFERKVISTLGNSVNAAIHAAGQAVIESTFNPFSSAVEAGVSANLCEAIIRLFQADERQSYDLSISWAQNRPAPTSVPNNMFLSADIAPTLEEAARIYRARETLDDYLVEGTVIKLERSEQDSIGKATVYGKVEDSMRKVIVSLRGNDYSLATSAHDTRRPVRVTGNIVKDGRQSRIDNPTNFTLCNDEE